MEDTEEALSFPATTPQDKQRCTRLTGSKKAECLTCNKSRTGTHHVRDLSQELDGTVTHNERELSQELETTPPPKKIFKPPAPPDHVISSITADFQQAFLDNDLEEIKILLTFFDLHVKTSLNIFKHDCSKLTKTFKTASELIEPKYPTSFCTCHHANISSSTSNCQYEITQSWAHQMDWVKLWFLSMDRISSFKPL